MKRRFAFRSAGRATTGLLHDVGHGPFGHFFDHEVLEQWHLDHEVVGRHLVTHQLADIIGSLRASPSDRFAGGEHIDPMWVAWVMADADIEGYTPPGWLHALKPILCGPATVDNLDYVPRDAYMCGISLGAVEVQRLIHYTFVSGDSIVLHAHAAGALEMFLASRLYMYLQDYDEEFPQSQPLNVWDDCATMKNRRLRETIDAPTKATKSKCATPLAIVISL